MNSTDSLFLTAIGSVITFIMAQKWLLPLLIKGWEWIINKKNDLDKKQLDVVDEIHKVRMNENEYYEETFNTLLGQIEKLENELKLYSNELTNLRNEILLLNSKLYKKSMIILDLQKRCCLNEYCKDRICCENKIEKLVTNETEG